MADFTTQIQAFYNAIQYRNGPPADVSAFNAQLMAGTTTLAGVQTAIINDPFTTNVVDAVIREYQAGLGRIPDEPGIAFWVGQVAANPANLLRLSVIFANSTEFGNDFGGANATTPANSALVNGLYHNVLQRAPDAAGLAFWVNSGLNGAQLLQAFAQSPEFINDTTPHIVAFQTEISNNPSAPYPTGTLFSIPTSGGNVAFTLTVGIDTHSTSQDNAVFSAPIGQNPTTLLPADTLNTGDNISDTGANGTLNATVVGGFTAAATVTDFATHNYTSTGGGIFIVGASGVTGLTSLNLMDSSVGGSGVAIAGGSTLATALTSAGITNSPAHVTLQANFSAGALASNPALNVTVSGSGAAPTGVAAGPATAAVLAMVAATNAATYGTYNISVGVNPSGTGAVNWLELSQGVAAAETTAIAIGSLAGDTGGLQLSQDAAGDFANVKTITGTIPASGSTAAETFAGDLWITGAAANTTGAYANAGAAGFLTGNTALTGFTGGTGSNFIDISHLTTAAAVNGVDINDSASAATTNTVVLSDAVVSGAVGLTNMTNVQVIGDTKVGGGATINWMNMPSGANTLEEFGLQVAGVTISNAPSTFNVDVNGNDQGAFAINVSAAVAGSAFDLTLGNSSYETPATGLVNQYDHVGALTVGSSTLPGYTNDTITSNGNAVAFSPTAAIATQANEINSVDLWAGAAPITLTITGPANLVIPGPGGATPAVNLHGTNPTIIDNDTGVVVMSVASTVSTDATKIDATNSGGLWMAAPDGGNTGSNGVTIIGASAHPNYLFGSAGNDPLTGSSTTDTFITQGGGDVISLLAGHQNDAIDLYPTVGPTLRDDQPGG